MTDSGRARNEARTHWEMIQDKNVSKPKKKKPPEWASCGNCTWYKVFRCTFKKKAVKPYNICSEWITNQEKVS